MPVPPAESREYHQFFRTERYRLWKSMLAIVLAPAGIYLTGAIVIFFYMLYVGITGAEDTYKLHLIGKTTPALFLINNLNIALCILLVFGIAAILFHQKSGYMSSITGKFRWRLFWRFMFIIVPFFAVFFITGLLTAGMPKFEITSTTIPMIIIILLTTPLQCAGEEYLYRGLINRACGGVFQNRMAGLICGIIISSATFAYAHHSTDFGLNMFYLANGVAACLLVWKTGGLEAAVAHHIISNFAGGLAVLPFTDFSNMFTGRNSDILTLMQTLTTICAAAAVIWQARRLALPTNAVPPH